MLAAEGKWEEAYQKSSQLNDIRDFYGDVFLWDVVHTFTYASALASMKVWFEEIGLQAGPIRPPVAQATDELRQRIKTTLKELGVS